VLRVEATDVFGEPALGNGDQLRAAEIEIERGAEDGFKGVEPEFNSLLLVFQPFDEFAFGFFSDGGEIFAETFGVGSEIVGVQEIGLDVGIADDSCCAAQSADRTSKRFGLLVDAGDVGGENVGGENEEFESGFDSPRGGPQMMDAFGRGFFEAGGNGCLEHQALTKEGGNGLRHHFTFRYRCTTGPEDDTTPEQKLRATGAMNGCSVRCKQEVVMKLTSVKSMVMKGVTVGLIAGAFALAAPAKAQAQQFAVGVQFGSPGYGYAAPGDYYARQRYEELCRQRAFAAQQAYARQQAWAQREAFERHEAIERQEAYGRGYDRDRDRRDHDDHRDWDRR
jgi:hypothetical protein